jgi:hypothetical protein
MRERRDILRSTGLGDELQAICDSAIQAGLTVKDPAVQVALINLYASLKRDEWIEEGVRALEYIKDEMRRDRRGRG